VNPRPSSADPESLMQYDWSTLAEQASAFFEEHVSPHSVHP
jgi:hypothetical protein